MKVTFKTLMNEQFELEFEEDSTVLHIKEQIHEHHPDFTTENIKLISIGRVLDNRQTLKDIQFKEGRFIVVFDTQNKDARPSSNESVQAKGSAESPVRPSPTRAAESASPAGSDPPILLEMAEQREKLKAELMEMGFDRDSVSLALRASFFNPDRAVEYLLSGNIPTPEEDAAESPTTVPSTSSATESQSSHPASTANSAAVSNSSQILKSLRTQPQFQELRQVIRQNPDMLATVIAQIGQTHPQLLEAIEQNEEEFLQMLTEDIVEDDGPEPNTSTTAESADTSGMHIVRLNEEERGAIDRLKELGFSESACLQAYFACDKDENDAANFLFSANLDEEDEGTQRRP